MVGASWTIIIHPEARAELREATAYYRPSTVAAAFGHAIESALKAIAESPLTWPPVGKRRRYLLRRFPYQVIYEVKPDHIHVLAFAHYSRRRYWRARK